MTDDDTACAEARARYLNGESVRSIVAAMRRGFPTVEAWLDDIMRPRGRIPGRPVAKASDKQSCVSNADAIDYIEVNRAKLIAADNAHLEDLRREHGLARPAKDGVNAG
jgi:hypothetical protein